MKTPPSSEGRVVRFRRPGALFPPPRPPVKDLRQYEHSPEPSDDYRHRMTMNGLGAAVAIVLILVGLWIVDVMTQFRKDQDCVLAGRRNCAQIALPAQPR